MPLRRRYFAESVANDPLSAYIVKVENALSRFVRITGLKNASAVNKASEAFYELHGVRTIDVHIVTCAPRKAMQTWKRLESALLDVFRNRYFQLPKYNKVRPTPRDGLFSAAALEKIISKFDVE